MAERQHRDLGSPVGLLITLAAVAASILLVLTAGDTVHHVAHNPGKIGVFLFLALALQFFSVQGYGKGSISVSAIGMLAAAFSLHVGPALGIALVVALTHWIRKRGLLHRAIFDAANLVLSTAGAAGLYSVIDTQSNVVKLVVATVAGIAYGAINHGLLCLAMSLSESSPLREVWNERFHWARYHFVAFGPSAVAISIAYDELGIVGIVAFTLPPAILVYSVRQYLERTRQAVEEVRKANEDLRLVNSQLEARNEDLNHLFRFAGGLASQAHDQTALVAYAEESLSSLTGAQAVIAVGAEGDGHGLVAGGARVGSVKLHEGPSFDGERWERLRDAILPQLATAIESAGLVEQVRKTHLATIAALSRSMEAKDYYTGGHTERVSDVAVALAKRLGYAGLELDAVEIGALLHDIGKIGIPERILHKPGPLDDEEWKVMKEHPVISEYILSGVDLPDVVLQIARSSHERMDGAGYPDGLKGEAIPLPARIVLVADAFDALTSDRPYRRGRPVAQAIDEIYANAGTQFCPRVVASLVALFREEPQVLGAGRLAAA